MKRMAPIAKRLINLMIILSLNKNLLSILYLPLFVSPFSCWQVSGYITHCTANKYASSQYQQQFTNFCVHFVHTLFILHTTPNIIRTAKKACSSIYHYQQDNNNPPRYGVICIRRKDARLHREPTDH